VKKKSTSFHGLNADYPLSKPQKALYLLLNRVNNSFPYMCRDREVTYTDFTCGDLAEQWHKIPLNSSPARRLCDLFCIKLPWQAIEQELGDIHILDCGCGSGRYGERLVQYSSVELASYLGIDAVKSDKWQELEKKYPNHSFKHLNSSDISGFIPEKTNFITSVTALEHFEEDILYFQQVRDFICSGERNLVQVHLFPSRACLKTYRFHGIRQFTPRTLRKITRLFHPFSYIKLYNLGGEMCNRLHYKYITRPMISKNPDEIDLRKSDLEAYDKRLFDAVQKDLSTPTRDPNFYAMVIHSYFRNKLF
jgi:SAM-dependent methyltransferase